MKISIVLFLGLSGPPAAPDGFAVELTAARPARRGTPLEAPLPPGAPTGVAWKLVRGADGMEIPVQSVPGRAPAVAWLLEEDLPAGGVRAYRLEAAAPTKAFPRLECLFVGGKHVLLRAADRDVLRYNAATVEAPAGVDPVFARSGYIHPVWTPSGRVVSNDFPPNHLHHHGLWFPWTSSEFEGRKVDFWNSKVKQGRVEAVKVEAAFEGPVFAGFRASHRFVDLTAPGGPRAALDEIWEVRVWSSGDSFLFDLISTQTCSTSSPLVIREYRYGGLGFRGSIRWEGKDGAAFRTSEGKGREDGHATTARWCAMSGTLDGRPAAVGFLGHPSNFRFPQPMRIHPTEPFFNWAPSQAGDFRIEPGRPYVSRYRFVVADGALGADEMDRRWSEYAEPPAVRLSPAK